jgi:catechol 2,3-dioxygenase-like lactoylglutathione lyase family enzyme
MIERQIGSVFLPVRNIELARDWYCRLLGLPEGGPILFGHIFVVPMLADSGLTLDSRDFRGPLDSTRDVPAAYSNMASMGIDIVTDIIDGVFFNFKDPDGNLLMVANVPLPKKG